MKHAILIAVIIASILALGANWTSDASWQSGYVLIRGSVNAADSGSTAVSLSTGGDFAHKPAWVASTRQGAFENSMSPTSDSAFGVQDELVISIVDASGNNAACDFTMYGWAKDNGMATPLFSVASATCGTQAVVKYPEDGSTATNAYWVTSGTVTSKACTVTAVNSGNSSVLIISGDFKAYRWLYPVVTAVSNGSAGAYGIKFYKRSY